MLDLSKLTFLDSSGIRALLLAKALCAEHDCEFLVAPGQAQVQGTLAVGGLLDYLPFRTDAGNVGSDRSGSNSQDGGRF
jgi:anti-anti-sigma factor